MTGLTRTQGGAVAFQATYTYDALDRRIGVHEDPDGVGNAPAISAWTVYDGANPYHTVESSGASTRYLHADAVDALLARTDGAGATSSTSWYLGDRLGSVGQIVNAQGVVTGSRTYDGYGVIAASSGTMDRFAYTGRELTNVGGGATWQSHRARYYDAAIGRWTQEDPIGLAGGDANLYRYVGNSPTKGTDPLGLWGERVMGMSSRHDRGGKPRQGGGRGPAGGALSSFVNGAVYGDFSDDDSLSATTGKIVGGLNPMADARDVAANAKEVWLQPTHLAPYVGLGLAAAGCFPLFGDVIKALGTTGKAAAKVGSEAAERLAATRGFRSISGVERFDRLATECTDQLQNFLREVEANEWIVKESKLLGPDSPAYFFPRKGRFYFDPERMTYLDMLHEGSHLESFIRRGNWKLGKYNSLASQDEVAAYSLELQLLREAGGANPSYLDYLERQIEYYRRLPEILRDTRK